MKRAYAACLSLLLLSCLAVGQEWNPPVYKQKGGDAELTLRNERPGDVWDALTKALEAMHWKIMNRTESGLFINVMADLPDETDQMKVPKAFIGVAAEFTDVQVVGTWYLGQKGKAKSPKDQAKLFWDELFARMAEALK